MRRIRKKLSKTIAAVAICLFFAPVSNATLLWNIEDGISEYRSENYTFAKDYFLDYTINNPNDEDGYFWLAKTYQSLKNHKKAQENFKKAYDLVAKEKNIEKIDFTHKSIADLEDYFDMATMYLDSGKIKEAQIYVDMMLKINPKSASAFFIKAKIAQLKKDEKQAIEFLNLAITYNNDLLYTNLASSLGIVKMPMVNNEIYESNALDAYFAGDLSKAILSMERAFDNKKQPQMINFLAELYIKNNNITAASDVLDESLKINDSNLQTYLLKSQVYKIKKDDSKREESLLKAYKLNPNHQQTLLLLGEYYLEKKDWEKANKYFEILINVNDALYEGYFGYIYSLIESGKVDKAVGYMRKITLLNPKSSEVPFLLAKICKAKGDYKEAFTYISDALDKAQNPNYYLEAAKINTVLKKPAAAISNLNDAMKMPYSVINNDEINDYYIKNLIELKDLDTLKIYLGEKNILDKNRLMYKYYLYVMYKLNGKDDKAQSLITQLKKAKTSTISDYIDLSEIMLKEEGTTSAIKILDNAIKKYPKEAKLYYEKIKLYYLSEQQEKKQEVIDTMKKVFQ